MAAPFGHSHLISYECLGDSSPSVLCLFTLTPMVIPFFWYCSPGNGSQLLCCLTSIIAMILKELSLVHSFSHRETFIHFFTQNIDLKPLDWAKLIPDGLHPGRCDSTVILLLSTQSSFREEVQNHWISARGAGMLFSKIHGEGNKCYSNVWFKESWLLGMNFCNLFGENQIQPFTFLLSFFLSCPCWANEKNLSRA